MSEAQLLILAAADVKRCEKAIVQADLAEASAKSGLEDAQLGADRARLAYQRSLFAYNELDRASRVAPAEAHGDDA